MITGVVTRDLEATVRLSLRGPTGATGDVDAVLDTGFTGELTLPVSVVQALSLRQLGSRRATLADGSVVSLDLYEGFVTWDGGDRDILVLQADGGPLIGMELLRGCRVEFLVVDGGGLTIEI